jgi:drug/metabolite transporter (DMT)-like permease
MAIPGEFLALLTTLSWTVCIFPFTSAARKLGPDTVNLFRLLLAFIVLTLVLPLFTGINVFAFATGISSEQWLWFGSSGIIGLALGDHFGFRAFMILGPRLASVFSILSPGFSLLLAYFLVDERINTAGMLGIMLSVLALSWLSFSTAEKAIFRGQDFGKFGFGVVCGFIGAACQGTGIVLANKGFLAGGESLNPVAATWIRLITGLAVVAVIYFMAGKIKPILKSISGDKKKGVRDAVLGTVFGPLAGVIFSMYAIEALENKPSVAQTIFSSLPIFSLLAARIFLREKIPGKSGGAVLLGFMGVCLLIWRVELQEFLAAF